MSSVDEKTELEKRWEAEEDLHMEDNPYAASESEKESVDFNKGEDESLFIPSPVVEDEIPLHGTPFGCLVRMKAWWIECCC